jgi:hypothetical protein
MLSMRSQCLGFLVVSAILLGSPASAQNATGQISGVVRDSAGATRESATVRAVSTATGTTRSTVTRGDGTYAITGLTPGSYTVSAALIGFRRTNRTVQLQQDATVDLVLQPLPLQAITVTATLREEELADVPFSVAAPSAKDLRERGAPGSAYRTSGLDRARSPFGAPRPARSLAINPA